MSGLFSLSLKAPKVMGILNVTPDSFSDGGKFAQLEQAIAQAMLIESQGAAMLDVGAESTRPGSAAITAEEEIKRLEPVLTELKKLNYRTPVSLDTSKVEVAAWAWSRKLVRAINDVEGLRDEKMREFVCREKIPVIVMHMQGVPRTMQQTYHYDDVVKDVYAFFARRLEEINGRTEVMLDPGIGFGKSLEHNLALLNYLDHFLSLKAPILVGASRKSFIGKILDADVDQRLEGSLAAAVISVYKGAHWVRVHDVKPTVQAMRVAGAIRDI